MSADRPDRDGSMTRHSGDGWCQFASAHLSAKDLEYIHCGVVEWGENVGGSSRSERVVTTRHSGDGWWRFVSVRLFARDVENSHEGLYFSRNGTRDWLKIDWSEQSCMKLEVVTN